MRQIKLFWGVLLALGLCFSLAVLPAQAKDDDDDDHDKITPRILFASEGANGIITIVGIGLHDGTHTPEVSLKGIPLNGVTILDPDDGMMLEAELPPGAVPGSYELLVFPEGRDDDDDDDRHHGRKHDDDGDDGDVAHFVLTIEEASTGGGGGGSIMFGSASGTEVTVNSGQCESNRVFCPAGFSFTGGGFAITKIGGAVVNAGNPNNPNDRGNIDQLIHASAVRNSGSTVPIFGDFWDATVCLDNATGSPANITFNAFVSCAK
ncbi:MAG: hypothetical protein ACE5ER_04010 [Nitrospinaceae bacterium]